MSFQDLVARVRATPHRLLEKQDQDVLTESLIGDGLTPERRLENVQLLRSALDPKEPGTSLIIPFRRGFRYLVQILKQEKDVALRREVLGAIRNFCATESYDCRRFAELGGIPVLLEIFQSGQEELILAALPIMALLPDTFGEDTMRDAAGRAKMRDAGAISTLLDLMKKIDGNPDFPNRDEALEETVRTLARIISGDSAPFKKEEDATPIFDKLLPFVERLTENDFPKGVARDILTSLRIVGVHESLATKFSENDKASKRALSFLKSNDAEDVLAGVAALEILLQFSPKGPVKYAIKVGALDLVRSLLKNENIDAKIRIVEGSKLLAKFVVADPEEVKQVANHGVLTRLSDLLHEYPGEKIVHMPDRTEILDVFWKLYKCDASLQDPSPEAAKSSVPNFNAPIFVNLSRYIRQHQDAQNIRRPNRPKSLDVAMQVVSYLIHHMKSWGTLDPENENYKRYYSYLKETIANKQARWLHRHARSVVKIQTTMEEEQKKLEEESKVQDDAEEGKMQDDDEEGKMQDDAEGDRMQDDADVASDAGKTDA